MHIAACPAAAARPTPGACAARRRPRPCCAPGPAPTAPGPRFAPRRPAAGLHDLRGDGTPAPAAARAADAARGFAAGNGYLTGALVDRFI